MVGFQRLAAVVVLLLGIGLFYVRQNVAKIERSKPGERFAMSLKEGEGQWGRVIERKGVTKDGLPMQILTTVHPANITMKGAYKDHPASPPPHLHMYQDEIFTIKRGRMGYYQDGEGEYKEGSGPVTLPYGKFHTFWNADPARDLEVEIQLVTRVGKDTDFVAFLETFFGLSRDNGGPENVNPLQLFLTFWEGGHLELALPAPIRAIIPYTICPLAKLVGYKATYPEYTSGV